jgi:hypothetical protein
MLPILRILPVGGVLLAILILVLALSPPDGSRVPLNQAIVPARGALLDRDRHPEVKQFLILSAIKRADELNRLRELADTPVRSDKARPKVAGLPSDRSDTDRTSSITGTPGVSIPAEIGGPSSTELPAAAPEQTTPATKAQRESRRRAHRVHTVKGTKPQFNFFEMLFGEQPYQRPAYSTQQPAQRYQQPAYNTQQPGQPRQQPAYSTQQPGQPRQQPAYSTQQPAQPGQPRQQPAYNAQQPGQRRQPAYGAQLYQPYTSPDATEQSAFSQVPRTTPY